jgi:4-carboxymuconolactone decarboxylase
MPRIQGVAPKEAGLMTRIIYWLVKKKVGQVTGRRCMVEPIKVTAHHPRLLKAMGQMEMGQEGARTVAAHLKTLASIKSAMLIGCPF